MLSVERIVKKLKGIVRKAGSKRKGGVQKNAPFPVDEIGYEASGLMSQNRHVKQDMK